MDRLLHQLAPVLTEAISSADHEIGECYMEECEDGCFFVQDYKTNTFTYEADGWSVEVTYRCCGEYDEDPGDRWTPGATVLKRAWGNVTGLSVSHFDEVTDEERIYADSELTELRDALDVMLSELV